MSKNSKLTSEEVKHVGKLANLKLSSQEEKKFKGQLEETIEYINDLTEVDTSGTQPTSQVTGLENVYREDKVKPSLSQKEVLANGVKTDKGYFIVKKYGIE